MSSIRTSERLGNLGVAPGSLMMIIRLLDLHITCRTLIASFIRRDGDDDDDDGNDTGYTIGTTTTTTAIATPATSTTSATTTTTTTKQQPPQSTTTTTTTTTTSCTCKIPYITGCSCMIKGAYAYATCNMQHAHAAGHAVYLPSPRLTPFASFRLATPNRMYLCMPIARANPNLIQSYLLEVQKIEP